MDAPEMKDLFLIEFDRINNSDAPGYTDEEISHLLTAAQEELTHHVYNPLANEYKEGVEATEFTTADLQELVKTATLSVSADQTGVVNNGTFFDLPSDHYLTLVEMVTTTSDNACYNNKQPVVSVITHDEYTANLNNPFKKPRGDEAVWRLAHSGRRFELITSDDFDVATYTMRYLKKPRPIIVADGITIDGFTDQQDCELKDTTHRRIVSYAVRKASAITDPEMYQIKAYEQKSGN